MCPYTMITIMLLRNNLMAGDNGPNKSCKEIKQDIMLYMPKCPHFVS